MQAPLDILQNEPLRQFYLMRFQIPPERFDDERIYIGEPTGLNIGLNLFR